MFGSDAMESKLQNPANNPTDPKKGTDSPKMQQTEFTILGQTVMLPYVSLTL
jgi:hypothetical protein